MTPEESERLILGGVVLGSPGVLWVMRLQMLEHGHAQEAWLAGWLALAAVGAAAVVLGGWLNLSSLVPMARRGLRWFTQARGAARGGER